MKPDIIGVIEAAYNIDKSADAWLRGLLASAPPLIDKTMGMIAFTYDASDPGNFRILTFAHNGLTNAFAEHYTANIRRVDANYIRQTFCSLACGTAIESPGWYSVPYLEPAARLFGIADALSINGVNPDGHGCVITGLFSERAPLTCRRRDMLSKLACHIAAAYRLRRRLASVETTREHPCAIIDRNGKLCHAEGGARTTAAVAQLRESVAALAHARGPLRSRNPERAVEQWKALTSARWSLLDTYESDGRRYVVAWKNEHRTKATKSLTLRERQVVALAATGQHNKLIAYNLGVSHSTVRVLMARAATKLCAGSRADLLRQLEKLED